MPLEQMSTPAPNDPIDAAPVVDIVIPVHNEQVDLESTVRRLAAHVGTQLPYCVRITIADNASTDRTWPIARRLAADLPGVRAVRLEEKGRGRALRAAWAASDADVLAYMDVDLSTDLAALLPLLAPLISGHSDVAIGTRLRPTSRVVRGPKRELISRGYNLLLRATLRAGFSDAQCGFKAIRADAAGVLLPLVEDTGWFFDTELLVLAERCGMRIHEVPVDWVDDPDSRVDILDTARTDIAGIWRLALGLGTGRIPVAHLRSARELETVGGAPPGIVGQLVRFAIIGVLSTLAYAVLYWVLRSGLSAQWANGLALMATAIGNTAANRWFTFGVRGPTDRLRHQAQGLVVFGLGLLVTSGALLLLGALAPGAGRSVELVVLTVANVLATLLRFVLYRAWVFRSRRREPMTTTPTPDVTAPMTSPAPAPALPLRRR
jgi:putative flippase GtrA